MKAHQKLCPGSWVGLRLGLTLDLRWWAGSLLMWLWVAKSVATFHAKVTIVITERPQSPM